MPSIFLLFGALFVVLFITVLLIVGLSHQTPTALPLTNDKMYIKNK